jgi:A/G-specific adenine glycosylase
MTADPDPAPADLTLWRNTIQTGLIPWFNQHQRPLPWRKRRTPYRVWISEAMLVQTRVDQVIPYYQRFLKQFPSIRALAEAPIDDVLKVWEGLGYYSRARNLQRAAQQIMAHHNGRFPRDITAIRRLPGIGPYMAAAIASLAFGQNHAVLDGNVMRVISRLTACNQDLRRPATRHHLQQLADHLLTEGQAGNHNEALMELGATRCTPRQPDCLHCPLQTVCRAFKMNAVDRYPRVTPRRAVPHKEVGAGVVVNRRGEVLIARRLDTAMLGGLWEFPGGTLEPDETMPACIARELQEELGIQTHIGDRLMIVRHAYSHFTIALHVHWARILKGRPRAIQCSAYRWCRIDELSQFAFSRADLHVVEQLQKGTYNLKDFGSNSPSVIAS